MTRSQPAASGNLAPRPSRRPWKLDIDERALAVAGAPAADRVIVGGAAIGQRFDCVEAAEAARLSAAPRIQRAERRADRAGLAGVGVDHDLRVGNLAGDEIDLRLDHREIAVRAALEHELAPDRAQVLQLAGIDPDVERQHGGERGHDLLGRPALALLVDDVGLQEHAAPHGESGHGLGLEGALGVALERDAVALGDSLQKGAVARRALRVEPKVGDRAMAQHHDLHVGSRRRRR